MHGKIAVVQASIDEMDVGLSNFHGCLCLMGAGLWRTGRLLECCRARSGASILREKRLNYFLIKHLHVTCVVISVGLFMVRGTLELGTRPWRQWRVLRVAPHAIDTVLLGSALWMAWRIGQYPFINGWLTAKVLALLAYILLGMRVLDAKTPPRQKPVFFVAALLCVGYIVGVALTRSPSWGWS